MKLFFKLTCSLFFIFTLSGCSIGYIVSSGYHQSKLLLSRQDVETVLSNPQIDSKTKEKLLLAQDAKDFSVQKLGLAPSENYSSYVELNRPYVTWVVRVAQAYQLKSHTWWFPIVGDVPYKGFFNKEDAKSEAKKFNSHEYDTYVRGVSAYSTLGWFDDPILSSMINYKDHDLVELIIHESVHATIYIKSNADFNERLATFLGKEGVKLYYKQKFGKQSKPFQLLLNEGYDRDLFSKFISDEIKELERWYNDHKDKITPSLKRQRLQAITHRFVAQVKPRLKSQLYNHFENIELNNAKLLSMKTYISDLEDFKKLLAKNDGSFHRTLEDCKKLKSSTTPEEDLKKLLY